MATKSDHRMYLEGSETYAALHAQFGRTMPLASASKFAQAHGIDLQSEGIETGEICLMNGPRVATLSLVKWLGY